MNERSRLQKLNRVLTIQEMNDAAKKIEIDGEEAFQIVSEMYGGQVAKLLLITHIRRRMGSMRQYPPDPEIDDKIFETF